MKEVLIIIAEMSACGGASYLLYLLAVYTLGKRLSHAGRFVYLKLAALLFALPVSKALSPLLSVTERLTEIASNAVNTPPVIPSPSEPVFVTDIPAQMVIPPVTLPPGVAVPPQISPEAAAEAATKSVDILAVLVVIWLAGLAVMLIWRMICRVRFERGIKGMLVPAGEDILSVYRHCCESMGITRDIPVFICEKVYTPMIVSAVSPKIILPQKPISPRSIEFVFRHELTHYQRGDIFVKMFVSLISAVHWFNPIVHVFKHGLISNLELSCDERAGGMLDINGRKDYCMAILEAVPVKRTADVGLVFGTSGKKKLKKRLDNMLNFKKMRLSQKIIAAVVAVVIIVISCVLVACAIPVDRTSDDDLPDDLNSVTDDADDSELRYNVNSVTLEAISFEKYRLTNSEINELFDALSLLKFSENDEFNGPWLVGAPQIICTVKTDGETIIIEFLETAADGTHISVERGNEAVIYNICSDPIVRGVIHETIVEKAGIDFSRDVAVPDETDKDDIADEIQDRIEETIREEYIKDNYTTHEIYISIGHMVDGDVDYTSDDSQEVAIRLRFAMPNEWNYRASNLFGIGGVFPTEELDDDYSIGKLSFIKQIYSEERSKGLYDYKAHVNYQSYMDGEYKDVEMYIYIVSRGGYSAFFSFEANDYDEAMVQDILSSVEVYHVPVDEDVESIAAKLRDEYGIEATSFVTPLGTQKIWIYVNSIEEVEPVCEILTELGYNGYDNDLFLFRIWN